MMDTSPKEPTTIGLSDEAHAMLKRLTEDKQNGTFAEMTDAYRFGIALAVAHGVIPEDVSSPRTIFNVGTLDPDKQIYTTIKSLMNTGDTSIYQWVERLAEWGIREMSSMADRGDLDIGSILAKAQEDVQGRT